MVAGTEGCGGRRRTCGIEGTPGRFRWTILWGTASGDACLRSLYSCIHLLAVFVLRRIYFAVPRRNLLSPEVDDLPKHRLIRLEVLVSSDRENRIFCVMRDSVCAHIYVVDQTCSSIGQADEVYSSLVYTWHIHDEIIS